MNCKKVKQLLLEESDKIDKCMDFKIRDHISRCSRCTAYADRLDLIRKSIRDESAALPPQSLVRETREICHTKIYEIFSYRTAGRSDRKVSSMPAGILACILSIVFITFAWLIYLLIKFSTERFASMETLIVSAILLQNLYVILFAPILINKFKRAKCSYI